MIAKMNRGYAFKDYAFVLLAILWLQAVRANATTPQQHSDPHRQLQCSRDDHQNECNWTLECIIKYGLLDSFDCRRNEGGVCYCWPLPGQVCGCRGVVSPPPPSPPPTQSPTPRPTPRPTRRPTPRPTPRPTKQPTPPPTPGPTPQPTKRPTPIPTKQPVTTQPAPSPTKQPQAPPTPRPTSVPVLPPPTERPTRAPSLPPTNRPTNGPTQEPTRQPINRPTRRPTDPPVRDPTDKQPTEMPTMSPPTVVATDSPVSPGFLFEKLDLRVEGVEIALSLDDTRRFLQAKDSVCNEKWAAKLRVMISTEAKRIIAGYESVDVMVVDASSVSNNSTATLVFSVLFEIRSPLEEHDTSRYIEGTLDAEVEEEEFIKYLTNLDECPSFFSDITEVALTIPKPTDPPSSTKEDKSSSSSLTGIITGLAVAIGGVLLLIAGFLYVRGRQLRKREEDEEEGHKPIIFTHTYRSDDEKDHVDEVVGLEREGANNEVSTLGEPFPEVALNEQSTLGGSSIDYDFQNAFKDQKSTANESEVVGSAGDTTETDKPYLTGGYVINGHPGDESSLDTGGYSLEERFEVVAPAGKLGLILQSARDGRPSIHKIKASSILNNVVKVGDMILSVDGADVTECTANEVSRIIASKVNAKERVILFSRGIDQNNSTVGERS